MIKFFIYSFVCTIFLGLCACKTIKPTDPILGYWELQSPENGKNPIKIILFFKENNNYEELVSDSKNNISKKVGIYKKTTDTLTFGKTMYQYRLENDSLAIFDTQKKFQIFYKRANLFYEPAKPQQKTDPGVIKNTPQ